VNAAGEIEPLTPEGPSLTEQDDQEPLGVATEQSSSESDILSFFKEEVQQVLHQYPHLSREDPSVKEALEAFEQSVRPAYKLHVASQQKLRRKLPNPKDRTKLDQLKAHLASKKDDLEAEVAVLNGISERIAKLQEESEAQQRIVAKQRQQVDQFELEVAAQRELVMKSADPGLRSRLETQDMRFKVGMVAILGNLISAAIEDPQ
jgi:chromosome segregation ATPase